MALKHLGLPRTPKLTAAHPTVSGVARQAGADEGGASGVAAQSSFGGVAVVASPLAVVHRPVLLCRTSTQRHVSRGTAARHMHWE